MVPVANALAFFTLASFLLLLPPFAWHIRSHNIPAISLIAWLLYGNLKSFVNVLLWGGESPDVFDGKIYCDIVVRLDAASSTGKIAAIAALSLNLYMVLAASSTAFLESSRRRCIINVCMCWMTPIFIMATLYVIQHRRYAIVRYRGCLLVADESYAALFLYGWWAILWSAIAAVFAAMILATYARKRRDVKDILRVTNSGLNFQRFARLLIFSLLILLVMIPVTVYYFSKDAKQYAHPFLWSLAHSDLWSEIVYGDFGTSILYQQWVDVALSILTFVLFGLGADAIEMYKDALRRLGFAFKDRRTNNGNILVTKELSGASSNTRVGTNTLKAGRSMVSDRPSVKTFMNEYGDDFHELVTDEKCASDKSPISFAVGTVDLERGTPTGLDDNSFERVLEYNLDYTPEESDDIAYNFRVRQNS